MGETLLYGASFGGEPIEKAVWSENKVAASLRQHAPPLAHVPC